MNQMTIKDAARKLGIEAVELLMDLEDAGNPRQAELKYADFAVRIEWNPTRLTVSYFEIVSY